MQAIKTSSTRIKSEIFISLETILYVFSVWQYHFPLKSLFWLQHHFRLVQLVSSVSLLDSQMCKFYCPLRRNRGTDVPIWQHIHQTD